MAFLGVILQFDAIVYHGTRFPIYRWMMSLTNFVEFFLTLEIGFCDRHEASLSF